MEDENNITSNVTSDADIKLALSGYNILYISHSTNSLYDILTYILTEVNAVGELLH